MSELATAILARCVPEGDCLIWQGAKTPEGYGVKREAGRRLGYVHRLIYRELRGPIPEGHQIDHVRARGCRSTSCCNVEHLEPVTSLENHRRAGRLTPAQVAEIRSSEENNSQLARRLGVAVATVWKVRAGRTWKEAA